MAETTTTWTEDSSTAATALVDSPSNVTVDGDLTVTGGKITFGNGEIMHNESDDAIIFNTPNLSIDALSRSNNENAVLALVPALSYDSSILFKNGVLAKWYVGNDATDDKFKIGSGIAVGTTAKLIVDTSNVNITTAVTLDSTLDVASTINVGAASGMTLDDFEIDVEGGNLTLDVEGDIELNADGGDITFKDDAVIMGALDTDSMLFQSTGTANNNTIFGKDAGDAIASGGNDNTAIGHQALTDNDTGSRNTAVGYRALFVVNPASAVNTNNTSVGWYAGGGISTGVDNTCIGTQAGQNVTTSSNSTLIGSGAGGAMTGADGDNVCIGYNAFTSAGADDGLKNVVIGSEAMASHNVNASDRNVVIGYSALKGGTGGAQNNNVVIGAYAAWGSTNTSTYNVVIGDNACGDGALTGTSNIAIGTNAALNLSSGASNVVIGRAAGEEMSTGSSNTFIGFSAAKGNASAPLTGEQNTCVGYYAGLALQGDADYNTCIGSQAGQAITTGDANISIGRASCNALVTGGSNVAIGNSALEAANGSESHNVAIGFSALAALNSDENNLNVAVGYTAGITISSGTQCVFIGADADGGAGNDNQIAIGYGAETSASNAVKIGNASISAANIQVDWTIDSDIRIKKEITDNTLGLSFINSLKTKKYKKLHPADWDVAIREERYEDGLRDDFDDEKVWDGLIAQDVKEAIDNSGTTFSGWHEDDNGKQGVQYSAMVVPLIKAVQELSVQVEELKSKLGE